MELAGSAKPSAAEPPPPPAPEPKPAPAPQAAPEPAPSAPYVATPILSKDPWEMRPREFLAEIADEGTNYYRASDETVELVAALYSDGRIRLADGDGRRFAGALIAGHADLLELRHNEWSEVFLRVTPTGRMQLELRGGPYDAHVLTCEALYA